MRDCNPVDVLSDVLMDLPDMVFAYSTDGRVMFLNEAAATFLQADPVEVIGYHWRELGSPPHIMEPLMEHVLHVANTCTGDRYRFTTTPLKGSRTFDVSLAPLCCEAGDVFAVLAIMHDISEFVGEPAT